MKDRTGYDYAELVSIQRDHLALWQPRLRPALFNEVRDYALRTNREAQKDGDKHRVYRGQDLVELFRLWPDIGPAYEPRLVENLSQAMGLDYGLKVAAKAADDI